MVTEAPGDYDKLLTAWAESRERHLAAEAKVMRMEGDLAAMMLRQSLATGHGDNFDDLLREAEWQIEELRKRSVWRSVDDDPPPHGEQVLLWSPPSIGRPEGEIEARAFSTGRSGPGWSEYSQHSYATHWQPLPRGIIAG